MTAVAADVPRRVTLDKIASGTFLAKLTERVDIGYDIPAQEGAVVVGRVRNLKTTYNKLEDLHGRMRHIRPGDLVAGVLGHRDALHGYVGHVPDVVRPGDILNLLNLGGVIGLCTSANPDVGPPFELEILGAVMHYPIFGERVPKALVIERSPELDNPSLPERMPAIAAVVGSSMNAGKTTAICEILRHFRKMGRAVAAAKVSGVSLLRDVLEMSDFGAVKVASFMDFGVITTSGDTTARVTKAVMRSLAQEQVDMVILEFGDGLLGTYGVREALSDPDIRNSIKATVLCATDPVAAWGGVTLLRERFGITPCAVTGPATDNLGGSKAIEREFALPAFNARLQGEELAGAMRAALG